MPCPRSTSRLIATGFAVLLALASSSGAQTPDTLELRQTESVEEYRRLSREIALSAQRERALEKEIAAMRNDSEALTAALIQAAKTERKLTEEIVEIGHRLEGYSDEETALRASLSKRRGILAEVLAALQRMGLNPPPALLVRPEDALASVRSAILLGAVVPELRVETESLITDLQDLSRVIDAIASEQSSLFEKGIAQTEEQQRLKLLIEEKNRMQATVEANVGKEREVAAELASRARDVQELISSLESQIASLKNPSAPPAGGIPGASGNLPLVQQKGMLTLPVPGSFAKRFGDDDGLGSTVKGDILKTHSGAIVTAPIGSTVIYAGPFRSYGQILILNPGDGYHVVLAGMERLNVSIGQTVISGEPVGAMGEAKLASMMAMPLDATAAELYIEFRLDGKPVDPQPWWAHDNAGRTKHGT